MSQYKYFCLTKITFSTFGIDEQRVNLIANHSITNIKLVKLLFLFGELTFYFQANFFSLKFKSIFFAFFFVQSFPFLFFLISLFR